jgi:hypothetical protein
MLHGMLDLKGKRTLETAGGVLYLVAAKGLLTDMCVLSLACFGKDNSPDT